MRLERFDVIVVPFPFTDLPVRKRRPAVVLSNHAWHVATGEVFAAMITTAARSNWPLDVPLTDLAIAGLAHPCCVRVKLFTVETALVQRLAGRLSASDAAAARPSLLGLLGG